MIVIELRGGLGNQLFQYAAGIALSEFHKVDLSVDITQLKTPDEILRTYRKYILSGLATPPSIYHQRKTARITSKLNINIQKILPTKFKNFFYEKHFHYNSLFWKTNKDVFLRGNFQSENYFREFKKKVLEKIVFLTNEFSLESIDILNTVKQTNCISIHIRRGDYVSNSVANHVLGTLPIDYYKQAYNEILKKESIDKCFIFSDDIEWAKLNLSFLPNSTFISSIEQNKDIVDFVLMQSCKHNIIANSSFSWWAAYLNSNPNKIVIAPKRWFNQVDYNTKDLFPESWITI